jgi:FkbM family methyltransferase
LSKIILDEYSKFLQTPLEIKNFKITHKIINKFYYSVNRFGGSEMDIVTMIKDLYYCNFNPQLWINHRFQDKTKIIIEKSVVDYITTPEGLHFYPFGIEILYQVIWEYKFDDLKPDDIVLDLGANIGGFSLRAAQKCDHVYAVEPLYTDELNANIALNNLQDKITVIPFGIGLGDRISIRYQNREKVIQTYPLSEILKMIGTVTFLKCDIEGAEWSINPKDLEGIRRMEFEVHQGRDSCMPENLKLLEYIRQNWRTETDPKTKQNPGCYIHAYPHQDSDL